MCLFQWFVHKTEYAGVLSTTSKTLVISNRNASERKMWAKCEKERTAYKFNQYQGN